MSPSIEGYDWAVGKYAWNLGECQWVICGGGGGGDDDDDDDDLQLVFVD